MKRESGQALVLVLLSLAVVLTIVLFILSRTVTDISVSSKSEEAIRAFSAAEAGVEQSLVIGTGGSTSFGNSSSYSANVSSVAQGQYDFNYPIEMSSQDSINVWLVSHDSTTGNLVCDGTHPCFTGPQMKVCWGKTGTGGSSATAPAVETSVFYDATPGNLATIQIGRGAYDPNASRAVNNKFAASDAGACTIGGVSYAFQKTFNFSDFGIPAASYGTANGLQFVRFRMFYNTDATHPIGVTVSFPGDSTLPSQGNLISSTGTAGGSNRKLNVFQGWPEPPSVFDNVIYSSTGITK